MKSVEEMNDNIDIQGLDNLLYGSLNLPADFDYDSEIQNALSLKYSLK